MIKVLVPMMPTADQLLPYLRQIDESRVYCKNGPLVNRLEMELSALVRAPCTTVSNGTLAIELALRALNLPRRAGVLVPAVTFVATGQAIVNAGLSPVICDVDAGTWQLDADMALTLCSEHPSIRCALPVAAFGRPVPVDPWEHFSYETNLPVLIDAAGAIYDQQSSPYPEIVVSYSLNATKALGAGEGGVVATCDLLLGERVASLANFGAGGTNARMSEYHAAVALASLHRHEADDWRALLAVWYAERWPRVCTVGGGEAQTHRTLLPVLLPPHASAASVREAMLHAGIETKAWYRPFLDELPEFHGFAHIWPTPTTDMLRERLLGLPYHAFLTADDAERVCTTLSEILA